MSTCDWQNLCTNKISVTLFNLKKMLVYCWDCDFQGLKVSQGKVRTINRWDGILNHLSMEYLLSDICTKNYWNPTTIVEIIVGGWVVSFFETQCTYTIPFFVEERMILWYRLVLQCSVERRTSDQWRTCATHSQRFYRVGYVIWYRGDMIELFNYIR